MTDLAVSTMGSCCGSGVFTNRHNKLFEMLNVRLETH
jgi:hypothetical protein